MLSYNMNARDKKESYVKLTVYFSYIIPLLGLFFYFKWKKTRPDDSKAVLRTVTLHLSLLLSIFFFYFNYFSVFSIRDTFLYGVRENYTRIQLYKFNKYLVIMIFFTLLFFYYINDVRIKDESKFFKKVVLSIIFTFLLSLCSICYYYIMS